MRTRMLRFSCGSRSRSHDTVEPAVEVVRDCQVVLGLEPRPCTATTLLCRKADVSHGRLNNSSTDFHTDSARTGRCSKFSSLVLGGVTSSTDGNAGCRGETGTINRWRGERATQKIKSTAMNDIKQYADHDGHKRGRFKILNSRSPSAWLQTR